MKQRQLLSNLAEGVLEKTEFAGGLRDKPSPLAHKAGMDVLSVGDAEAYAKYVLPIFRAPTSNLL